MEKLRLPLACLLAGLLVAVPATSATAACPPPVEYTNQTTAFDQGVLVSFATDRQTYAAGQLIHFYLSMENQGTEAAYFPCAVAPEYYIVMTPSSCSAPDEEGCIEVDSLPEGVYFFSPGVNILPGGCYVVEPVLSYTTSGQFPPAAGTYRLFAGLRGYDPDVFSVPSGGAVLTITVAAATGIPDEDPPEIRVPETWGAIKAFYR